MRDIIIGAAALALYALTLGAIGATIWKEVNECAGDEESDT